MRLIASDGFIGEGAPICYLSLSCLKALEKTPSDAESRPASLEYLNQPAIAHFHLTRPLYRQYEEGVHKSFFVLGETRHFYPGFSLRDCEAETVSEPDLRQCHFTPTIKAFNARFYSKAHRRDDNGKTGQVKKKNRLDIFVYSKTRTLKISGRITMSFAFNMTARCSPNAPNRQFRTSVNGS